MKGESARADALIDKALAEIVAVYLRLETEREAALDRVVADDSDREADAILSAYGHVETYLERAILEIREVSTVGDLSSCETEELRRSGLYYLIQQERPASDELVPYLEAVDDFDLATPEVFATIPPAASGTELCEWIDQRYPPDGVDKEAK